MYSDGFISDASDLIAGVFANFDTETTENADTDVDIGYYVVKSSVTVDSQIVGQGKSIWTANQFSGSTTTNAPATNSTFTTNLANGFILTTGGSGNEFFDEQIKVVRIKTVTTTAGGATHTISDTVEIGVGSCDANQLIFNGLSNADRYSAGQHDGGILVKGSNHYIIQGTLGKAVKLSGATAGFGTTAVQISKSYVENYSSNTATYYFYDVGLTAGAMQPFVDDAKTAVHYKYSQMLGNRLFAGNVKLDPSGDNEDHPDWIIFSESGMPDVLPVVNYIQIKDQQGGQIMAMNKLLDSLVVFMSRGTFRLDVNSVNDPSSWQLMESDSHIGCVAPKGVVNIKDNLFFCSHDAVYQITPDFRFTPISEPIKDVYQSASSIASSRLMYDVKRNRLLCGFGSSTDTMYAYDLISNVWSTLKFNATPGKFYSSNDSLDVFGFYHASPDNPGDAVNSLIYSLHQSGSSESMDIVYQTGFKNITRMDKNSIVRRVNLNYESSAALTCKLYSDGDMTTVRGTLTFPANNSSKDYLVSIRPSGVRASSLALKISATTSAAVKINKVEIETDEENKICK